MFHKFSSKFRNPKNKPGRASPTIASPIGNPSPTPTSPTLASLDDDESLDSYGAFHAEFLFPVDDHQAHQAGVTPAFDPQLDSSSSFSHSDENEQSFPASSTVPEEEINTGPPVLPDYDDAEEQFLEEFEDYFENLSVDHIRKEQYRNLDLQKIVHLDYANHPLFSHSQVEEHMRFLLEEVPCSGAVSESNFNFRSRISGLEERFLSLFNTRKESYALFFTTGVSGSFKLLGEAYSFDRSTQLMVCQDTHEQVRYLLPAALRSRSRTTVVPLRSSDLSVSSGEFTRLLHKATTRLTAQGGGLVVFSAQSKVSGNLHPLEWIQEVQSHHGWHVAVDVSMMLPAAGALDLSVYQPEFVVGSVENAFGYPPATGYLLVKRDVYPQVLKRVRKSNSTSLVSGIHLVGEELNTIHLVGVASGLEQLEITGLDKIHKRGICLSKWIWVQLKRFKHADRESKSMIRLYGSEGNSIVLFNLVDSTGNLFPPRIVQKLAERQNIKLGICGYENHPLFQGGKSGSLAAFSAVSLSLGCVSTFQDCYRFIQFLMRFRDEEYMSAEAMGYIEELKHT